jgi:hypothetical protein
LRIKFLMGFLCALAVVCGCGGPETSNQNAAPPAPAKPAVPEDIQSVAQSMLGSDAEVVAWGDLALNGNQEVLAVNHIYAQGAASAGLIISRLSITEDDDGKWKEVLRCDEHLKNGNGFLGGAPIANVSAWRLQYARDRKEGLQLFFTPYKQGPDVLTTAIEVRWNPEVRRYEAMDAAHEHFMGEAPSLEPVIRKLGPGS